MPTVESESRRLAIAHIERRNHLCHRAYHKKQKATHLAFVLERVIARDLSVLKERHKAGEFGKCKWKDWMAQTFPGSVSRLYAIWQCLKAPDPEAEKQRQNRENARRVREHGERAKAATVEPAPEASNVVPLRQPAPDETQEEPTPEATANNVASNWQREALALLERASREDLEWAIQWMRFDEFVRASGVDPEFVKQWLAIEIAERLKEQGRAA